jgi:hypothetical protein
MLHEHLTAADPVVAEHRGRIVKTTGDGVLIEFPSVVGAVQCAVALQKLMAASSNGKSGSLSLPAHHPALRDGDQLPVDPLAPLAAAAATGAVVPALDPVAPVASEGAASPPMPSGGLRGRGPSKPDRPNPNEELTARLAPDQGFGNTRTNRRIPYDHGH